MLFEEHPNIGIRGIDHHPLTGLSVFKLDQSYIGKGPFTGISNRDRGEVVFTSRDMQGIALAEAGKVGDQKTDCTLLEDFTQEIECFFEVGGSVLSFMGENISDDIPDVGPALLWRDIMLDGIGEDNEPDPVVFADRSECEDRGDLGRYLVFGFVLGPEITRRADVNHEHHGQLALFAVDLHVRLGGPGSNFPVDMTDIVAGNIGPGFLELHTSTFKRTLVLTGECVGHQSLGADMDCADPCQELAWQGISDGGGSRH